jgi:hypothetical protein
MALFALKILSGTTDAHRHGLEQALSDTFRHKIQIAHLKAFNIFPQFFVEIEAMQGEGATGQRIFSAEKVRVAFTFMDLLRKKGTFEDIKITDLRFDPGAFGQQELVIATADIVPASESAPAHLKMQGDYGGIPFSGTIELFSVPGRRRPAYKLGTDNSLDLRLGDFHLKGKLLQNRDGFPTIREARLDLNGKEIATGQIMLKPVSEKFAIHVEFRTGQSAGTVVHVPAENRQDWNFETLALNDVTRDQPVWAEVGKEWHDVLRPGSVQTDKGLKIISVAIKKLTGDISGDNLKGRFISDSGQTAGWWQGALSLIPAKDKIPGSGQVECGLVRLVPKGDTWVSDVLLTKIDSVTIKSDLSVHEYTGKVNFQTDRVASGPAVFNADLSPFITHKDELKPGAGCSQFPGLDSP